MCSCKVEYGIVISSGIVSGHNDDYPYSWSVPAYHPTTQKYKNAKVGHLAITDEFNIHYRTQ